MTSRGLVVALACGALTVVMAGCGGTANSTATATPASSPAPTTSPARFVATAPPINFEGNRVGSRYVYATKQKGGREVYVLRADSVEAVYNGAATARSAFTNPHVVFYGDHGKRLLADAPAGTVAEKDKTVVMSGGVHAKTNDGMTLASDTLQYDDESQIVHGTGHVVVRFPEGEELRGDTVTWNLRDGHIGVAGTR
jgi:LPS export ABC transporter protein LptC